MKRIQIERPAPVVNIADFHLVFGGRSGVEIPLNEKGHPHHFEWVALPGMEFEVAEERVIANNIRIYQILCPSYPASTLYIDSRFCGKTNAQPFHMLSVQEAAQRMESLIGTPYVWGGNWHQGIPEMLEYYPPHGTIDNKTRTLWTLSGVDCSGLLFEVFNGATPRNTSQLIRYGDPVPIAGLSRDQIRSLLKPMDLILYQGHVLYVLDENHIIESKSPFGVITRNLIERLDEIMSERTGVNAWSESIASGLQFLIRRIPHLVND